MANNKKLLRLSSTSNDGNFSAEFRDEILISPNSEIALRGLSFDRSDPVILINGNNDLISFQAQPNSDGGQLHTINLPHGSFSSSNIRDFFIQFENLLNGKSRISNVKELGLQYYVGSNDDNKFELRAIQNPYLLSANLNNADFYPYKFFNAKVDAGGAQPFGEPIIQTVGTVGTILDFNVSNVFQNIPFTKGAGVYRIRIREMVTNVTTTAGILVMGLCNDITKLQSNTIDVASMEIAIEVVSETANYRVKTPNTTLSAFVEAPASAGANRGPDTRNRLVADVDDHDVLEITLSQNVLTAGVHTTEGFSVFATYPYDRTTANRGKELYPFLVLYKPETNIKVDQWESNWDESYTDYYNPLQPIRNRTPTLLSNYSANHVTMLEPSHATSIWKLETNSVRLSRFLGWGKNVFGTDLRGGSAPFGGGDPIPEQNELVLYNTTADTEYSPGQRGFPDLYFVVGGGHSPGGGFGFSSSGVQGDAIIYSLLTSNIYLVELLNMKVDSYDNFDSKRGRANILAVINANEYNSGNIDKVLMYEPSNAIYISLLNAQELSLRNIRLRIVNLDYSPIETSGTSTVTLHLRPGT